MAKASRIEDYVSRSERINNAHNHDNEAWNANISRWKQLKLNNTSLFKRHDELFTFPDDVIGEVSQFQLNHIASFLSMPIFLQDRRLPSGD